MVRQLIDFISHFACWVKRNRIITPKDQAVKVNIGSGLSVTPGWLNVDASLNAFFSKWPRFLLNILYRISGSKEFCPPEKYRDILRNHPFLHHNVEYGIPLPLESCDYLYFSHFLEKLFREDAEKFFKEAYRVLKKNGIIRICILDLERIIMLYQKGNKEYLLKLLFATSKSGYFSRCKHIYDFDLLRQFLEKAGFVNIERCSYREGKTPDIDLLDNRPQETLYVEACKS